MFFPSIINFLTLVILQVPRDGMSEEEDSDPDVPLANLTKQVRILCSFNGFGLIFFIFLFDRRDLIVKQTEIVQLKMTLRWHNFSQMLLQRFDFFLAFFFPYLYIF